MEPIPLSQWGNVQPQKDPNASIPMNQWPSMSPDQSAEVLGHANSLNLGSFAKGIAKGAVSTLNSANVLDTMHGMANQPTLKDVTGVDPNEALKAQNLSEQTGKGIEALAEIIPGAGKAVMAGGEKIAKMGLPLIESEAGKIQSFRAKVPFLERLFGTSKVKPPSTTAQTVFDKGMMGTESMLGVQAKKRMTQLWPSIEPELKNSKASVDMPSFFQDAEKKIVENSKELGDRSSRVEALKAVAEDYKNNPKANMEELQGYKEGWASHVPNKYYQGKDITQTYNNVRAELANTAREEIYKNLGPKVKQSYIDYGNYKAVSELGKKAMAGSGFKGGTGKMLSTLKEMTLVPIGTISGQAIYKVGQGLEFVGKPGAKVLGDLLPEYMLTQAIKQPIDGARSLLGQ